MHEPHAEELSWDAARVTAHACVRPLGRSEASLTAALGRTLAEPLCAPRPIPSFSSSAMDGYAVRGDPPWRIVGRTLAGEPAGPPLGAGQAWEVATGAAVPDGTDAVLPYEHGRTDGDRLTGQPRSANIRRRGEEAVDGDQLLAAGTRVTPQVIALAAVAGFDILPVRQVPRVTAVITGDEVRAVGQPGPGTVRDALGPALGGLCAWVGADLRAVAYVEDDRAALKSVLADADADVVVVSGSSSAGPRDYLRSCLTDLGARPLIDCVQCQPGHTQSLWRCPDGRLVVGLPGNPLAALASFVTLAAPACAGLLGEPVPALCDVVAPELTRLPGRTRIVPVRLEDGTARPVGHDRSAMLRGIAVADGLAIVPPLTQPSDHVRLHSLPC